MNLDKILLKHYNLYPEMQIQDVVKLIYQNEFGGGHLIRNKSDSLKRLQEEYNSLTIKDIEIIHDSELLLGESKLFLDIGNNLFRLNLKVIKNAENKRTGIVDNANKNNKDINNFDNADNMLVDCKYINLSTINSFFVNTANSISGNVYNFEVKLEIFKMLCKKGIMPFSITSIEDYLRKYKADGYPAVSHSEAYRSTYSPAYRIVEARYWDFFEIFCRIDTLLKSKDRITVAIDGNSGSGKSTLAGLIADVYDDCNIFHMDDYFLTPELRTEERLNEVGGNVDYVRFKNEIIKGLNSSTEFQYQKFDCQQGILQGPFNVTPKKLNIIEGSYSMHPTLRENYDLKIFLHIDPEEQSRRILKRNGEKMHKIFINRWIPLENRYFTEMRIKEQSDLVFNV